MVSQLDIFNMALTAAGSRQLLAAVNANSTEAQLCRTWYDLSRDQVFRKAFWPTTRKTQELVLVAEDKGGSWSANKPPLPWKFAFATPADMEVARELYDGVTGEVAGPFSLYTMNNQPVIVCNVRRAVLSYGARLTDPNHWDTHLLSAVVHKLAANISMPLSVEPNISTLLFQKAEYYINEAIMQQANQDAVRLTVPTMDLQQSRQGYPR